MQTRFTAEQLSNPLIQEADSICENVFIVVFAQRHALHLF